MVKLYVFSKRYVFSRLFGCMGNGYFIYNIIIILYMLY